MKSRKYKNNKVANIKTLIKNECCELGFVKDWFYKTHLLAVEKFSKKLLRKFPKADKEIVMLGVWLHDLQRIRGIRGIRGNHTKIGAREAEKVMKGFDYDKKTIKHVKEIILTHSCDTNLKPKTIEGRILASADAMSHYVNDFYLIIAVTGERNLEEYKKWALEKLERDYNKKIFFEFAKKMIKKEHDIIKKFLTM